VGINDKAFRLRAARDLLHLKGKYEPSFKRRIELIIEILGMIHSPRNLSYCRRETAKLRAATPNPTPEQIQLFGVLDDRLFKKAELIKARQERKRHPGKPGKKSKAPAVVLAPPTSPTTLADLWATEPEPAETNDETKSEEGGNHDVDTEPAPQSQPSETTRA
jgi:hypothetical protein